MISGNLYRKARRHMVGGVSASGRFHPALKGPLLLKAARGSRLIDVDGREWIDFHTSSGAAFLGYDHPAIKKALRQCLGLGFFMNFESKYHAELAALISRMVPCADKVRFCNSGTEATLGAVRLARGATGKNKILKFEGHFHGMHEFVFYNWHSRLGKISPSGEIAPVRDSAGIPGTIDDLVITIPYNNPEALKKAVRKYGDDLAAVILEPVMYNAGCIEPLPGFLQTVRRVTRENNIVLIFDEVLSGFRMGPGGAQEYYGVTPDLCTLAKAVGCGMGIAVLAGKDKVMKNLGPGGGKVVMSGTYSGGLIPVMGALAALKVINRPGFYRALNQKADHFYGQINHLFKKTGVKGILQGLGARFGLYFGCENKVRDFREAAARYNLKAGKRFIELALKEHLYFHDYGDSLVPMHCGFSASHSARDFQTTLTRMEKIFLRMAREGF